MSTDRWKGEGRVCSTTRRQRLRLHCALEMSPLSPSDTCWFLPQTLQSAVMQSVESENVMLLGGEFFESEVSDKSEPMTYLLVL